MTDLCGKQVSLSAPRRTAAFTFIELVIAIALSIVLLRGMYTIFHAATRLASMCEEKTCVLLEASAAFDYMAGDLARVPASGNRLFKVQDGGQTLIVKALARAGSDPYVYIKYKYESGGGKLTRSVWKDESCSQRADDDGDGSDDSDMVVGRQVKSFDVEYHVAGGIDGTWGAGEADNTKAVKVALEQGSPSWRAGVSDGDKDMERLQSVEFEIILPITSL